MDERAASNTQPSGDSTVRSALRLSSDWVSPINATVFTSTLILDLLAPLCLDERPAGSQPSPGQLVFCSC